VRGRTDGRDRTGETAFISRLRQARRFLGEALIMADCDVKKTEKTLSDRFSKLSLNSVSVLERGILLYLIVSYCILLYLIVSSS